MAPRWSRLPGLLRAQHRNTLILMLNQVTGAATGFLFWFLLARVVDLPAAELGIGYAAVALGTTVGVLAKGGLDTALVRTVPMASDEEAARLLRFSTLLGGAVAVLLAATLAVASRHGGALPDMHGWAWAMVALIGALMVVTWLQDAYFLADGRVRLSFHRNLVLSGARLTLPVPVVLLAAPAPVPLTWMLALAASAGAAFLLARRRTPRPGRQVPRREFLRSAARNVTGAAAEFLPGLLLAPMVLALSGPEPAAYFGIAWTGASLLFLASAAIGRSAMAEMVKGDLSASGPAIRRGGLQALVLLGPGALVAVALAPFLLGLFGADYAHHGTTAFQILCVSTLFVAPAYLYLAYLRARERPLPLILFPAAMMVALFALAPPLQLRFGLGGVALAWTLANVPFGLWGAWRLHQATKEAARASHNGTTTD